MPAPVLLLVLGLAGYRLTRLAVKDMFPPVAGPRQRLERRTLGTRLDWLGDLVTCHWCASGWLTLALVAAVDLLSSQPVPLPPVFWLATWAISAGLAHLEPEK